MNTKNLALLRFVKAGSRLQERKLFFQKKEGKGNSQFAITMIIERAKFQMNLYCHAWKKCIRSLILSSILILVFPRRRLAVNSELLYSPQRLSSQSIDISAFSWLFICQDIVPCFYQRGVDDWDEDWDVRILMKRADLTSSSQKSMCYCLMDTLLLPSYSSQASAAIEEE